MRSDITTLHITTTQRVTPLLSGASDQGGVGQRSSEVAENKNKRVIFCPSDSSVCVFETDGQFFFLIPLQVLSKAAEMACGYHGDSVVETGQYDFNTLNCNTWLPH